MKVMCCRKLVLMGLLPLMFGILAGDGSAATNPTPFEDYVDFIYNGKTYSGLLLKGDRYRPNDTGWCEQHYTGERNKFQHVHITSAFPLITKIDNVICYIWASNVDAAYDVYFFPKGYSRVSGADLTTNCYGYALGLTDIWFDDLAGVHQVLADDWRVEVSPATEIGTNIYEAHMFKVFGIYWNSA